jgi:peptidylprolyl isomerase
MLRTLNSRRSFPVVLLAAGALLLTGCGSKSHATASSTGSPSANATAIVDANHDGCLDFSPGPQSDEVKVSGTFGKTQTATFAKGLTSTSLQRTIALTGTGTKTVKGDEINSLITAYKGSDGSKLGSQPLAITVGDSKTIGAFAAGVDCVPIGSRVVTVVPAKALYGASGNPQAGIKATDSVVIVTDVLGKKVPLVPAAWTQDLPTVTFAANGTPTLKLPAGKPASKLELKVLKPGTGAVVATGDQVTLNYLGMSWNTRKVFDKSYGRGPATFGTEQVVPGFGAALVGQKVGTRLVVTIPPVDAYGVKGSGGGSPLEGQTLVFVIEITATAKS